MEEKVSLLRELEEAELLEINADDVEDSFITESSGGYFTLICC